MKMENQIFDTTTATTVERHGVPARRAGHTMPCVTPCLAILTLCLVGLLPSSSFAQDARKDAPALTARVVAVGIPGASAVAPVGFFHPGGPIHDNAGFAAFTQPGRILDRKRVLVTSNSNFGAPRAQADSAEGSVLSLDPEGAAIVVPANFAAAGNQASALDGRLQLFAAQSPSFLNSVRTPGAASAAFPTVSNPLGISINNAFGRLWFSNTPAGAQGIGTEAIADPSGEPLANAPSKLLGGVFAGDVTNRSPQAVAGALKTGAVATALLGMSPDGSKRAVFAVLTADGALAQAHTEFALDGLAPAGTIRPIPVPAVTEADRARITRAGMIFNWVPERILFVTDPERNAVVALTLTSDDKVFRVRDNRTFTPPELNVPVDLAPVVPETANPGFASNTTMAGNSDMYVANRGNGTIARMRQDGTVVAVRRVALPGGQDVGPGRLNGIAVSPDAQKIWVTVSGTLPEHANAPGALLEVPAFGPGRAALREGSQLTSVDGARGSPDLVDRGARLFQTEFTPQDGLGPLYNARSCLQCHQSPTAGGMGTKGLAVVHRVGRFDGRSFDPLVGSGGPVARAHTIAELGVPCDLPRGPPAAANLISVRNAAPLYGIGLIDRIPDAVILAGEVVRGGVKGRPNIVSDAQGFERVGRFGWKGDVATLEQFVAEAFRNELGITSPLAPIDLVAHGRNCGGTTAALDDDGMSIRAVSAYLAALPPLPPTFGAQHRAGETLFSAIGCPACHTPALSADGIDVQLYSDLLLHDMGPALNDGVVQGSATGKDWRTTPLWALGSRGRFLHDGRAVNINDAILVHDGEAAPAAKAFRQLSQDERAALLAFLSAL
jgi:hypothetical protein